MKIIIAQSRSQTAKKINGWTGGGNCYLLLLGRGNTYLRIILILLISTDYLINTLSEFIFTASLQRHTGVSSLMRPLCCSGLSPDTDHDKI